MRAYVLIHVRAGEEKHLTNTLKGKPGVLRADVTFGPYDVIAEVEAADLPESASSSTARSARRSV